MGPLLGGAIAHVLNNRAAFMSAGVLILMSTLLVILLVKEERIGMSKGRSSVFEAFKIAATNRSFSLILLLTAVVSISVMTIEPVISLYVVEIGGVADDASLLAGIVFSLVGIAGIIFAPLWGRLADKFGFRFVLIVGLLGGAIGNLLQIIFHDIWGFAIVRFVYGAFFCAVIPALNGMLVRNTPSDFRGRAFGLNNTASQLGSMIGPGIGGAIGAAFTIQGIFAATGVLLMGAVIIAYSLSEKRLTDQALAAAAPVEPITRTSET